MSIPDGTISARELMRIIDGYRSDSLGNVISAKINKSFNNNEDKKALMVIRKMPKWKPAIHNGKKVSSKLDIMIGYPIFS